MEQPWFRFYTEFLTDQKVQTLSEADQRRITMLFCLKKSGNLEALKKYGNDAKIAHALNISQAQLAGTKTRLIERGIITDDWYIIHWDDRQYVSDSSTERVRKFRDKQAKKEHQ